VNNAYDADATLVEIIGTDDMIEIRDSGDLPYERPKESETGIREAEQTPEGRVY
jgi:hypothetical protein